MYIQYGLATNALFIRHQAFTLIGDPIQVRSVLLFNLATEIVSALRSWKKYLLKSFGRDRLRLYFLCDGMLQGIELAKG